VLAYARYFDGSNDIVGLRRIASRIGTIYLFHLGTLILVVAGFCLVSTLIDVGEQIERMRIGSLMSGDPYAIAGAMMLVEQPTYFDILPLYIVLLAAFPLLYMLLRVNMTAAIAASACLWLIVQFLPINLLTRDGEDWHFNPFAWQLLLVLGMAASLSVRRGRLSRSPWLIGSAAIVLLVSFLLRAPWTNWPLHLGSPPIDLAPYGAWMVKSNLGPARLLHIIAFGYLLLVLIPPRASWLKRPLPRLIADAGTNSLEVYCLGVVLAVISAIILSAFGRSPAIESWITTAGVAALLLVGLALADRVRARKRRRARGKKIGDESPAVRAAAAAKAQWTGSVSAADNR
jgi:hypothetical protein